ncbi:hypothetical protein F3N42_03820 [Marinihelvus fidelis]|uniref:Uncharacterized protein n=1 Tax=Marinihelvus fidelis TaxID=2613842 RepID=A0A5N0TJJ1_9GAMM|nr:hypothetical protein [Marinihelvus fidelis]KAA9133489.1 hypothetical protein F3N42_03820 [Marinihelvus fidelis]
MRAIIDALREHRNGRLVDELDTKFGKLVKAVARTGKEGGITITLKLKPRPHTAGLQVEMLDNVKLSIPEPDKATTLFYTHDDELVREDPNQRSFDGMEIVDTDTGEIVRRGGAGSGETVVDQLRPFSEKLAGPKNRHS